MEKKRGKYLQTRYRRELERFLNRMVNFCRNGEGAGFCRFAVQQLAQLDRAEKRELYGDYFERLERFVESVRRLAGMAEAEADACAWVLKEANLMRKSRRMKSYSRKNRGREESEW